MGPGQVADAPFRDDSREDTYAAIASGATGAAIPPTVTFEQALP